MRLFHLCVALSTMIPLLTGCGAVNLGPFTPWVTTPASEQFYLLKESFLSSGSQSRRRETFDHHMYLTFRALEPCVVTITPMGASGSEAESLAWC